MIYRLLDKKILVLDDIPDNTFILRTLLEKHGAIIVASNEGSNALELFRRDGNIDAIITDLRMPGMSGQNFISEIRKFEEESKKKPVPIIVVTAENEPMEKINCLNSLGADDYLVKPIQLRDLLLSLSKLLLGVKKESKNILLIEDESLSATIISKLLLDQGHSTIVCGNILQVFFLCELHRQKIYFQRNIIN